jgi:hypothetical protein
MSRLVSKWRAARLGASAESPSLGSKATGPEPCFCRVGVHRTQTQEHYHVEPNESWIPRRSYALTTNLDNLGISWLRGSYGRGDCRRLLARRKTVLALIRGAGSPTQDLRATKSNAQCLRGSSLFARSRVLHVLAAALAVRRMPAMPREASTIAASSSRIEIRHFGCGESRDSYLIVQCLRLVVSD